MAESSNESSGGDSPTHLQFSAYDEREIETAELPMSAELADDNVTPYIRNGGYATADTEWSHAFRRLVCDIAGQLNKDPDVKNICYLKQVPDQEQSALDVLRHLHQRSAFSEHNVEPLADLLREINRADLIGKVDNFKSKLNRVRQRHFSMPPSVTRPTITVTHESVPRSSTFSGRSNLINGKNDHKEGLERASSENSQAVQCHVVLREPLPQFLRSNRSSFPPISETEPIQGGPPPPYYTSSTHSPAASLSHRRSDIYPYRHGGSSPANVHAVLSKKNSAPAAQGRLSGSSHSLHESHHGSPWTAYKIVSSPSSMRQSRESLHNNEETSCSISPTPILPVVRRQHSHHSLCSLPTTAYDSQHHVYSSALDISVATGQAQGYYFHSRCKCGHIIPIPVQLMPPSGVAVYPSPDHERVKQVSREISHETDLQGQHASDVQAQSPSVSSEAEQHQSMYDKSVNHAAAGGKDSSKNLVPDRKPNTVDTKASNSSLTKAVTKSDEGMTNSQENKPGHTSSSDTAHDQMSTSAAANVLHPAKKKHSLFLLKPKAKLVGPNKVVWQVKRDKLNKYIYKHTSRLLPCKTKLELIQPHDKVRGPLPKLSLYLHPYGAEEDENKCVTAKVVVELPKGKCPLHSDTMIKFAITAREGDGDSGVEIGRESATEKLLTTFFYLKNVITHERLKMSQSVYIHIQATVNIVESSSV